MTLSVADLEKPALLLCTASISYRLPTHTSETSSPPACQVLFLLFQLFFTICTSYPDIPQAV